MLKFFNTKRGQNTAEYAILIALVVGGVIAMQTYAQRTMQGRMRDASVMMRDQTSLLGNTLQYEPYYQNSSTQVDKDNTSTETGAMQTTTGIVTKGTESIEATEYRNDAVQATGITGESGF